MAHRHKIEIFMLTLSYIIIMLNRTNIDLASHMFLAHCPNAEASLVEIKSRDRHYKHNIASSTRPRVQNKCKYECKQCIFRLDTLTLSVIATSTWLAGWLAVTLRYCIKTAKPIGKLFRPPESPITLVFCDPCADTKFQGEPLQRGR